MSNWFSFDPTHRHPVTFRKKKGVAVYLFSGVLLALAGSWLVWALLDLRDLNPLVAPSDSAPGPLTGVFMPSVLHWENEIQTWATDRGLDPLLVATVMQIESCGDPSVVSYANAQGLFQVMPYHFTPGEVMLDPQTNATRGLDYLAQSYTLSNGDIELTLAGYNGGHGQISRSRELWPEETLRYVAWGAGIYWDAQAGDQKTPTLSDWLQAGGSHLCQQAEAHLGLK